MLRPADPSIRAVLFDFHCTLVDQGDGSAWLDLAWAALDRDGSAAEALGEPRATRLSDLLHHVWDGARDIDPHNRRDLDPIVHRRVFSELVHRHFADLDDDLIAALYASVTDLWTLYTDAIPTLIELRAAGVRTALVSNIGMDIHDVLDRCGLSELFDAVVLSYEVGAVKPERAIFEHALKLIDVPAHQALMVGDNWRDDAGAGEVGCRVLILPRTSGPDHGLDRVLALTRP